MRTLVMTVGFVIISIIAFGQNNQQAKTNEKTKSEAKTITKQAGGNFVDKNNDGICDNYKDGNRRGNGLRNGKGKGPNFVDKDNDGICDNYKDGNRRGNGLRNGKGKGPNFVDKNKNGICDHRE